jgi:glycosyltransferase involved in cell wall biosynthesis
MATRFEQAARLAAGRVGLELDVRTARRRGGADLAVFHEFAPPPSGGGNQFLGALVGELERRGLRVERNTISATTRACLFNSFNFDFRRLERFARDGVRMVHRVDGPIGAYRGFDDGTDDRIAAINRLADATVFQSRYSLEKHVELGYDLVEPHVIMNAVDPSVFHPGDRAPFAPGGPLRLIASSWSDNPRKGGATYRRLAETLSPERFPFLFVGRSSEALRNALPPVSPQRLAELLRDHDAFIAASEDDPCSNSVIEALACGLPVIYRRSGGHPEIVGDAGLGFDDEDEIPALLDLLVDHYDERRAAIAIPTLADVADAYLDVLGLDAV